MVEGVPECCARYGDKLFCMAGKAELAAFLEQPWRFASERLPAKLPPPRAQDGIQIPALSALPHIGYCEVHLGELLGAALAEAGELRPWLPSLSPRDTALKFVGLYLKVCPAAVIPPP